MTHALSLLYIINTLKPSTLYKGHASRLQMFIFPYYYWVHFEPLYKEQNGWLGPTCPLFRGFTVSLLYLYFHTVSLFVLTYKYIYCAYDTLFLSRAKIHHQCISCRHSCSVEKHSLLKTKLCILLIDFKYKTQI